MDLCDHFQNKLVSRYMMPGPFQKIHKHAKKELMKCNRTNENYNKNLFISPPKFKNLLMLQTSQLKILAYKKFAKQSLV